MQELTHAGLGKASVGKSTLAHPACVRADMHVAREEGEPGGPMAPHPGSTRPEAGSEPVCPAPDTAPHRHTTTAPWCSKLRTPWPSPSQAGLCTCLPGAPAAPNTVRVHKHSGELQGHLGASHLEGRPRKLRPRKLFAPDPRHPDPALAVGEGRVSLDPLEPTLEPRGEMHHSQLRASTLPLRSLKLDHTSNLAHRYTPQGEAGGPPPPPSEPH